MQAFMAVDAGAAESDACVCGECLPMQERPVGLLTRRQTQLLFVAISMVF